ncbi:MAG: RNA methyltransferase, partial [Terracidiphilus sp.]
MLTTAQRDRIHVVLVRPRNPLNIGAVARAMANFGFTRLTVVAPYEPHWREAQSAIGAEELLQRAIVSATLAEAVGQCTLVLGTGTLTQRKPDQPVVPLPTLAPHVDNALTANDQIALVLGPEKHGLTRDDLSLCHLLVEIPTDARQPSMNLGQAAAVCLYELALRCGAESAPGPPTPAGVAPSSTLD